MVSEGFEFYFAEIDYTVKDDFEFVAEIVGHNLVDFVIEMPFFVETGFVDFGYLEIQYSVVEVVDMRCLVDFAVILD